MKSGNARHSAWAGLAALGFGNFVIGTGTLIVPGMLPLIAEGIGVSLALAGQLVTAFAAAVCFGAPLLAGATGRYDRRSLLAATLLLFALGHLAAALVSSFLPMLAARVVASAGAALFTAQAAAAAALLVPPKARGRAIAFVFLGWSLAPVVGLPLGAYAGATWGWRAGFALVAAGAALGAAAVWSVVPTRLRVKPVDGAMWRAIVTNPALVSVFAVSALLMAAAFSLFSYLVPALRAFVDASPEAISLLLAAFGVMGIVGNLFAARFMDRLGAANVVLFGLLAMLAGHLLWPWSQGALAVLVAALLAWGLGGFASVSAQQARLMSLSPALAPGSIALNSSAVYLGQAVGGAAGGILIAHVPGSAGYASLSWLSVPMLLTAIGLSLLFSAPRLNVARLERMQ
jgi:predicted MFS family arabinose efflux permease